jgi:hypothetical protein
MLTISVKSLNEEYTQKIDQTNDEEERIELNKQLISKVKHD